MVLPLMIKSSLYTTKLNKITTKLMFARNIGSQHKERIKGRGHLKSGYN